MNNNEKPKADWKVKRDELADKYVFQDNGHWSNNNDECGDNFGSFVAGFNACREEMQREIDELRERICDESYNLDKRIEMLKNAEQIVYNLKDTLTKRDTVIAKLKGALEKAKSLSYSWVVAEETMNCKHTYEQIRNVINQALASIAEIERSDV